MLPIQRRNSYAALHFYGTSTRRHQSIFIMHKNYETVENAIDLRRSVRSLSGVISLAMYPHHLSKIRQWGERFDHRAIKSPLLQFRDRRSHHTDPLHLCAL